MTTRQQEALDFIQANQRRVTIGPSLRELAVAMGIAPNAAQQKVEALRREGVVAKNTGQGIVLAPAPKSTERKPLFRSPGKL